MRKESFLQVYVLAVVWHGRTFGLQQFATPGANGMGTCLNSIQFELFCIIYLFCTIYVMAMGKEVCMQGATAAAAKYMASSKCTVLLKVLLCY